MRQSKVLQPIEQKLVDIISEQGEVDSSIFERKTGSTSVSTVVLNINRKFPQKLIHERSHRNGRVTFAWNRSEDVKTVTYYYLDPDWEDILYGSAKAEQVLQT